MFINKNDLFDIPFTGLDMTWCKDKFDKDAIIEKLDRCLVNSNWLNNYMHCNLLNLGFLYSDHAPIVLICNGRFDIQVRKLFWFQAFWLNYPSLQEIILKSW